ncbi:MAG: hypothetical protein PHU85_01990 [Phycisphaerae bacterium]|nr:hypothetical protein [Phycisphaerae bacterium]
MRIIPLLDHEVRSPDLRSLWRPVKPQPTLWGDQYGVHYSWRGLVATHDLFFEEMKKLCPYGQPGDVVRLKHPKEGITYAHLASVAVRRVADATWDDAVAWGVGNSGGAVWHALDDMLAVWRENYGAAEWAWCVGLEDAR